VKGFWGEFSEQLPDSRNVTSSSSSYAPGCLVKQDYDQQRKGQISHAMILAGKRGTDGGTQTKRPPSQPPSPAFLGGVAVAVWGCGECERKL